MPRITSTVSIHHRTAAVTGRWGRVDVDRGGSQGAIHLAVEGAVDEGISSLEPGVGSVDKRPVRIHRERPVRRPAKEDSCQRIAVRIRIIAEQSRR